MNILEQADMSGMNLAGMAAMGKSGAKKAMDREEAERLGRAAANQTRGTASYDSKLRGVAEEFVSVFMNQVMKSMRATVQENPAMHGDNGEKFFSEMLDDKYASQLSKGSGYGLTDLVYQALSSKSRIKPAAEAAAPEAEIGAADTGGTSGVGL